MRPATSPARPTRGSSSPTPRSATPAARPATAPAACTSSPAARPARSSIPASRPRPASSATSTSAASSACPHTHPVIAGKVSCVDCHDVHQGNSIRGGGAALASQTETCLRCHTAAGRPLHLPARRDPRGRLHRLPQPARHGQRQDAGRPRRQPLPAVPPRRSSAPDSTSAATPAAAPTPTRSAPACRKAPAGRPAATRMSTARM